MGRKASLSDVQRANIVTLHEGHSERKIAVKMACSKLSIQPSIILNFMVIIPIRKRVVGREKHHVQMTTWWNWLFQELVGDLETVKINVHWYDEEDEPTKDTIQRITLCDVSPPRGAGGGGGTPGWGAEHAALRPSRGKENVGRRRRNRGLVARRGTRGGRRRNGGGKGWPPWTPP